MKARSNRTWEESIIWLREQPDKRDLVWNCYYDDPVEFAAERFSKSEEWQAVKRLLHRHLPGHVLDIGAGRGISSYAFARAGCAVVALEPDPSPLVGVRAIRSLLDNMSDRVQITQASGESLPFVQNHFDIVYGRAVLHHAHSLRGLCQEAGRVLRPGGIFIATREHVLSKKEDLQVFVKTHPLHAVYGGENAYLLQEYTDAMREAGIKLQKVIGPFESVINYAPMSQREFGSMVASALNMRLGGRVADWLARLSIVLRLFGWYFSNKSGTPGRHYSFLGIKK